MPVRNMELRDVDMAIELINKEGWGHTRIDIDRILSLSPESNLIWESDGVTRGFVTSLVYENSAMVGHVLVSKESRGHQIGKGLLKSLFDKLDSKGIDSIILYATEDGARLYRGLGFKETNDLFSAGLWIRESVKKTLEQECAKVQEADLDELVDMDAKTYGDSRSDLIRRLYRDFPEHCFKLERSGKSTGFVYGRRTPIGFDIGPWICMSGSEKDATSLLSSVIRSFPSGGRVDLSLFCDHPLAGKILSEFRQYKPLERVKLMVRGEPMYSHDRDKVFGTAGFELG
ncbi:MAG: GNAT family N-acetyltransferase [Candidatus Thermoplasmatota archaeon]|nr:GNAT family N-acetyltransferase [Candidatus Thermoplasmatota archaeon]